MALNPNIILQGRGVNALGAISEGNQVAAQTNQIRRQNALTGFLRNNGQAVMSGDPAALGQYAAIAGPEAALGVQQANLGMDATRLGMDATRQQMQIRETAEARAVAQYVAQQGAAQAAADLAEIESAMKSALPMVIGGDIAAFNQYTSQYGVPPVQNRDQMIAVMAQYDGVRGALKDALGMVAPPDIPAVQQNYERAVAQGYQGTFMDYQQAIARSGSGADAAVPLGTKGQILVQDPTAPGGVRVVNAEGSEAAREAQAAEQEAATLEEKEGETSRQTEIRMGTTLENIALNIADVEAGRPVLGIPGAITRMAPGTEASNFSVRNTQITTRAALDEIQNMRDNSPTGGAVGQLTDAERQAIGIAATSLSEALSPAEYLRAARRFRKTALDIAHGEGNWKIDQNGRLFVGDGIGRSGQAATEGDVPSWMLETSPSTWTVEQMEEAERIWGLK